MKALQDESKRPVKEIRAKRKKIGYGFIIFVIITLEIFLILFLYSKNILKLEKEMFYWLFATTAQSMAALFAVVGMFAVFRYQVLESRFNDLCGSIKRKFATEPWVYYFGSTYSESWANAMVINHVEDKLKILPANLPETMKQDLEVSAKILKSIETARRYVLIKAKVPLSAVLVTFLMAIACLPVSSLISLKFLGLIILSIIIAAISFSMISIFWYLIKSIGR